MPQNLKVETILLYNNAHNISLAQFCDYFKALTSSTHTQQLVTNTMEECTTLIFRFIYFLKIKKICSGKTWVMT
jgi:hypothetical protein